VRRYRVARRRDLKAFADHSDEVFSGYASVERQHEWFRANGPETPELLEHLRGNATRYDVVLFWAYRYAPSYFGLPLVQDRAVLVPTAEDDRAMDLEVLGDYFRRPRGYLFLTPEEQQLVSTRAGQRLEPSAVIGLGLNPASVTDHRALLAGHGIPDQYVLYLGRVDRNKGCDTLLEYFASFDGSGPLPTLVLAGPAKMHIPVHPRIRALGYVQDALREALLTHACALVVPSPYESLSIVLLEAWNHAVPALVNARCRVLGGQVRRANGGLYYRSALEFHHGLSYLLTHPAERNALGRQGRAYVEQEYRWPTVLQRVETLLAAVVQNRTAHP
jgi:glycosyltransferase involved in cell wall biosynthesis